MLIFKVLVLNRIVADCFDKKPTHKPQQAE